MPMKQRVITLSLACLCLCTTVQAQDARSLPQSWAGTWQGSLTNLPARAGAQPVEVTREIGEIPTEDEACTTWRSTYVENGEVRLVKDYRLCRGSGPDDWFIDEGDGIKLSSRWLDDVLVTPFKYDDILLIVSTRVRGDVMEEEILTVDDKPAIDGVQPMLPRSIQRMVLRRIDQ